ncbi:MAG: dTDP-4-dehydrorhamnose reductase [Parcubacteria group bacterium]|nr:dTDP-4-dehydrorhamnose reductase [Parcubacteria group bacterium]
MVIPTPILILGAKGMLGHALMDTFADLAPTGLDRDELDITNSIEVDAKFSLLTPKTIINAAAFTAVDQCENEATKPICDKVNGEAVGILAEAAKRISATIIHFSTDYVFDGTKQEGYLETDEPKNPVNAYGASKLAGEQALRSSGANFYLIRTAWLYGAYGKNFVDTMLSLGKTKKELTVVNDQHGKPTYTVDLAKATRRLLEGEYTPGVYHFVNEEATTWYDFAVEIFKQAKIPMQVHPIPSSDFLRPAKRPAYSILLNTKFPPLRPWKEALAEYLQPIIQNQDLAPLDPNLL